MTFDHYIAQLSEWLDMEEINGLRSEAFVCYQYALRAEVAAVHLVNYHGANPVRHPTLPVPLVLMLANLSTPATNAHNP